MPLNGNVMFSSSLAERHSRKRSGTYDWLIPSIQLPGYSFPIKWKTIEGVGHSLNLHLELGVVKLYLQRYKEFVIFEYGECFMSCLQHIRIIVYGGDTKKYLSRLCILVVANR